MLNHLRRYAWIPVALIFIGPFLLAAACIHPQLDDFLFTEITKVHGFIPAQQLFFNFWLGRYTSTALLCSFNPLLKRSVLLYQLLPVIVILLLLFSLQASFLKIFRPAINRSQGLTLAACFLAVFLLMMPSPAEGIYWMTGAYTYLLSVPLLLLLIVALAAINAGEPLYEFKGPGHFIVTGASALVLVGFNEITMIMVLLLMSVFFASITWRKRSMPLGLLALMILAGIAAIISIRAPGNAFRASVTSYFVNTGSLRYSIKQSIVAAFQYGGRWLTWLLPLSAPTLRLLARSSVTLSPRSGSFFNVHPALALLFCAFIVFVGFFPGFWAQGIILPARGINLILFHFMLGWMFFLGTMAVRIKAMAFHKRLYKIAMVAATGLFVTLICLAKNNLGTCIRECLNGSLTAYRRSGFSRISELEQCRTDTCVLKPLDAEPSTVFMFDLFGDPGNMENFCFASYYCKQGVVIAGRPVNPPDHRFDIFKWQIPRGLP